MAYRFEKDPLLALVSLSSAGIEKDPLLALVSVSSAGVEKDPLLALVSLSSAGVEKDPLLALVSHLQALKLTLGWKKEPEKDRLIGLDTHLMAYCRLRKGPSDRSGHSSDGLLQA